MKRIPSPNNVLVLFLWPLRFCLSWIWLRLVRTALLLAIVVGLPSCIPMDSVDTVLSESSSPDGQLIATVFERDCGATTAKNTQICFRRRTELFNSRNQPSFLVFEGDGKVVLSWESQNKLVIRLPRESKVFRENQEANGVKIEYVR